MYKKTQLDNGLKVVTYNMPRMQSVALGIWIKVGSRYEADESRGIAHYLEHLLFKGSKKYSCHKIKESIEGVGGSLNGFTTEELSCYMVKLPSCYLSLSLNILSDMVLNPDLLPKELEKERTVILEEIKMYKDQPQNYVHELLDELLWPKQPLGQGILGTYEVISKIQKDQILRFHREFYAPNNIIISAAGLLDHKQLVKSVGKIFLSSKEKKINSFLAAQEKQKQPQLRVFHKDTEQTHLALGFHGFKRGHPQRHVLGILHTILGANMSSRLFNELREKRGLAYEIGTQVRCFYDTGVFLVHAGIDNNRVIVALNIILKELKKIKDKMVNNNEFRRAKEFYLGQLMLALEDTMDHMLWIGETTATLDKTYSFEDIVKEVGKIKKDDIRMVAKQIFKDSKLNLALIGPLKDKEGSIYNRLHID